MTPAPHTASACPEPKPDPSPTPRTRPALLLTTLAGALLLLMTAALPATAARPATGYGADVPITHREATPVDANGRLQVCGTQLCNQHGAPVQLRGMSTHGTQWYAQCLTDASLDALARDWRADVLRVSTYVQEGGYETDPAHFTALADRLIRQASDRGLYVIVDWHMLTPGDPMANLDHATRFFTDIASRHKDRVNVLYEIANEPSGVSWSRIKEYAERIIPVVRAHAPDAPVLVGTRAWSSFGVSEEPTSRRS